MISGVAALFLLGALEAAPAPGVLERAGAQVPLDLGFTDQDGRQVQLGEVISPTVPTLLVFAYFDCPMLCGLVLKGTAKAVEQLGGKPGERYRILTVSIDPRDTPQAATRKQWNVLHTAAGDWPKASWPFLVGEAPAIRALAEAVGFRYTYDAESGQYVHPASLIVLAPGGRVARYLYGIDFPAADVQRALREAGDGASGPPFPRFLLLCLKYDPATQRYALDAVGVLRVVSVLATAAFAFAVARAWRREWRFVK